MVHESSGRQSQAGAACASGGLAKKTHTRTSGRVVAHKVDDMLGEEFLNCGNFPEIARFFLDSKALWIVRKIQFKRNNVEHRKKTEVKI